MVKWHKISVAQSMCRAYNIIVELFVVVSFLGSFACIFVCGGYCKSLFVQAIFKKRRIRVYPWENNQGYATDAVVIPVIIDKNNRERRFVYGKE